MQNLRFHWTVRIRVYFNKIPQLFLCTLSLTSMSLWGGKGLGLRPATINPLLNFIISDFHTWGSTARSSLGTGFLKAGSENRHHQVTLAACWDARSCAHPTLISWSIWWSPSMQL